MHSFRKEIVGLFGSPVDENPTVVMMEAAFADLGLDWRYITLEVAPTNLESAVRGSIAMGFRGFNCTIPHKKTVVPFLDELAPSATLMAAVNCVVISDKGRLVGHNTDGKGLVATLSRKRRLSGLRATMIGAGGAARAIAVELALAGVRQLSISNRSDGPAIELAQLLRTKVAEVAGATIEVKVHNFNEVGHLLNDTDILINATSVGLAPNYDARLPIDLGALNPSTIVADVIPNPPETNLIRAARSAGCTVVDGLEMLVAQGQIGLSIWSGKQAKPEVMRRALSELFAISDRG